MKFSLFQEKVKNILDRDLPSGKAVIAEGQKLAQEIRIGRTVFMEKMGVNSETEYKRQGIRDRKIMFHAHIGMSSWEATAKALHYIHNQAEKAGFIIDRAGICLDRRMGLPPEYRQQAPAETGPLLETHKAWMEIGSTVPIQPHMGDFMIGFPASTSNTIKALQAGVTTIGNLSQYFSHEAPMWRDPVTATGETVQALAIMGSLRNQGTLIHSYLEDGFGALFFDCASQAGWAYLEKYLAEQLMGGKVAHCLGGLTTDPIKRSGWIFALHAIHEQDCLGSMFYGDTISFTSDFFQNRGLVAEYLLWDIMTQLECPTGHAVHPLPVTEALRVASAEEIAEAQIFGRRIEKTARRLHPHMDFSKAHTFAQKIVSSGKEVFQNALQGLQEAGVNILDPVQLLLVLKQIGPAVFEEMFGAGKTEENQPRGRVPVVPTDMYVMLQTCLDQCRPQFADPRIRKLLYQRRMLIASTDVHEHAVMLMHTLLSEAGAEMINMGAEKNPNEIIAEAAAHKVDAILISTHNGMALDFAKRIKAELKKQKAAFPIIMGGVLNQKYEDRVLPVDVTQELKELGFRVSAKLEGGLDKLLEPKK